MTKGPFRLDDSIHVNYLNEKRALQKLRDRLTKDSFFGVNYTTTDSLLRKYLAKEIEEQDAIKRCHGLKVENNASSNLETTTLGMEYFQNINPNHVFTIKPRVWSLRSDIQLRCKTPFGYVDNDELILYMPHYRKGSSWALTEQGLYLQASVISHVFATDDYEGATIETVDMSVPLGEKKRSCIVKRYKANELIPESTLYAHFKTFVNAWDITQAKIKTTTIELPKGEEAES